MLIVINMLIILNILSIIGLLWSRKLLKQEKSSRFMANFSIFFGVCLILYIILIFGMSIYCLINNNLLFGYAFLITAILPLILGNMAKYNNLGRHINYQITILFVNLILVILFLSDCIIY